MTPTVADAVLCVPCVSCERCERAIQRACVGQAKGWVGPVVCMCVTENQCVCGCVRRYVCVTYTYVYSSKLLNPQSGLPAFDFGHLDVNLTLI